LTEARLARAISEVEDTLRSFQNVRQLAAGELAAYKSNFVAGWELPGLAKDPAVALRLLLPADAPHGRPRIAVHPAPRLLSWPHLEEHGLLCILPADATHQLESPGELAVTLLADGRTLVDECIDGVNHDDFETEFQSYWSRWPRTKARITSLCRHDGPTRDVFLWRGGGVSVVADDPGELRQWIRNRFATEPADLPHRRVPLLRLERPPHPDAYPASLGTMLALVGEENAGVVRRAILEDHADLVLCTAATRRGDVIFGVSFDLKEHAGRRASPTISRGFRPGRVPPNIQLLRYHALPLTGALVERADASWIHGRDQNPLLPRLLRAHVVVIGAGSLGSGIARLLAQSGIGRLDVVDPALFSSENASRHDLGSSAANRNKAIQLAKALRERFPHLVIDAFDVDAHSYTTTHREAFASADLVISATGNWRADSWLNAAALQHRRALPTLFTWLEPRAAAAHAVLTVGGSPCLLCLFDDAGGVRRKATHWRERTTRDVPGCAGSFEPYGAVELAHCQSLSAALAIESLVTDLERPQHRVWLSSQQSLVDAGGAWAEEWVATYGDPGKGALIAEVPFVESSSCSEHRNR
jgi:molybdopterin/thiamine biosynthesis adenylyltransferase